MKIKTQARLLVASIVLVPLLITLTNVVHGFFNIGSVTTLPIFEEIPALSEKNISSDEWNSISRFVARTSNFGEVTVFTEDYYSLYSTNPEFISGVYSDRESVLSLLEGGTEASTYIFTTRNLGESRIFTLTKAISPLTRLKTPFFFIPFIVIFVFSTLLTILSIVLAIFITRTITHSVQVLEDSTRRISEGELDLTIVAKGSNEIISLTKSLNKMRDALKDDERRRSRFIMGVTHDLKTPLALIKGYAEAIEDGVAEDSVSRTEAIGIITAKAEQLEEMIDDLVSYVRMETGEWKTQLQHINLPVFLHNLAKILKNDVELLQHTLLYEIDLPKDISIPLDEKLVLRAFENIIHNAIRYTPAESVVRLVAAFIENKVEITISDNGHGIDKDDIPHIFEMFYRGSFSRREQGMGLGLAVVKWVMDYHGWTISVSSEKDKGTCFYISIPYQQV